MSTRFILSRRADRNKTNFRCIVAGIFRYKKAQKDTNSYKWNLQAVYTANSTALSCRKPLKLDILKETAYGIGNMGVNMLFAYALYIFDYSRI